MYILHPYFFPLNTRVSGQDMVGLPSKEEPEKVSENNDLFILDKDLRMLWS